MSNKKQRHADHKKMLQGFFQTKPASKMQFSNKSLRPISICITDKALNTFELQMPAGNIMSMYKFINAIRQHLQMTVGQMECAGTKYLMEEIQNCYDYHHLNILLSFCGNPNDSFINSGETIFKAMRDECGITRWEDLNLQAVRAFIAIVMGVGLVVAAYCFVENCRRQVNVVVPHPQPANDLEAQPAADPQSNSAAVSAVELESVERSLTTPEVSVNSQANSRFSIYSPVISESVEVREVDEERLAFM